MKITERLVAFILGHSGFKLSHLSAVSLAQPLGDTQGAGLQLDMVV